jgi:hypothetical protein
MSNIVIYNVYAKTGDVDHGVVACSYSEWVAEESIASFQEYDKTDPEYTGTVYTIVEEEE